ncbi:MAG: HTTM domain-containing protein [Myxococcota bacterium]|nr:HTTM domain-containing protein [Myxococcota bacterium]
MVRSKFLSAVNRPTDPAGLAVLRILYGLLTCFSTVRFIMNGWLEAFYVTPDFHFKFLGAEWAVVPSVDVLYGLMLLMIVCSTFITLGLFFRVATGIYVACFTYIELLDVANYLNHYYLASLLGLLLLCTPADAAYSLRGTKGPIARWPYLLLRAQLAIVYFYAAAAKFNTDWLMHGQPLGIWLNARTEVPVIGSLFQYPEAALAMSWGGFLYDSTIVFWLLWARTRALAYAGVVIFHVMTGVLFNIGIFPWIMIIATTIFFQPAWPRRFTGSLSLAGTLRGQLSTPTVPLLILWLTFQIAWPARSFLYEGPVNWHEQGMRFSWKVMVREKSGDVTFRVRHRARQREELVPPARYLTSAQEREMSGQPDLILQLANHIAEEYRTKGMEDVEVRADAWVSWNGRVPARLIDPKIDLTTVQDDLTPAAWILPAPSTEPVQLTPRRITTP